MGKTTKSNLFLANLTKSNEEIKNTIALRVAASAEDAMDDRVKNLNKDIRGLEGKEEVLGDLSMPHNTIGNATSVDSFDSDEWAKQLVEVTLSLGNKRLELKVTKDLQKKYFSPTSK